MNKRKPRLTLDKFMEYVFPEPNTGCWLWAGFHNKQGYGKVTAPAYKMNLSHRLSYLLHNGEFDRSLLVLHRCDVSACVNPDHLFLGTNDDNIKDRDRKNRGVIPFGEKHGMSKLSDDKVREIRRLRESGVRVVEIAPVFSVTVRTVYDVLEGKIWRHVI